MSVSHMTRLPPEQEELIEEALCEIYECSENQRRDQQDIVSVLDAKVQPGIFEDLKRRGAVSVQAGEVSLAAEAETVAKRVVRRKRLAERLLKDVLNVKDEYIDPAACQWEHILSKEVTDSICTFLGHPQESPNGLPIPEGECCRHEVRNVASVICALDQLTPGDKAKVTYLMLQRNPELQRLLSLGLVPGATIELLQRFPTYVLKLDQSQLAFDEAIASAIFVHPLDVT